MLNLVYLYDTNYQLLPNGYPLTDKHPPWHSYLEYYDKEFLPYKKDVKIMEIGIYQGGFLFLLTKYFEKYDITGVDISDTLLYQGPFGAILEDDPNVHLHLGVDSTDEKAAKVFEDHTYDIIIDDGSHDVPTQLNTFKTYFSKLKKNGIYYIEDVLGLESMDVLKSSIIEYSTKKDLHLNLEIYEGTIPRGDDLILKITHSV